VFLVMALSFPANGLRRSAEVLRVVDAIAAHHLEPEHLPTEQEDLGDSMPMLALRTQCYVHC